MKRKKHNKRDRVRRRPNATFPANFGVGNRVRVKPGTTDPDFKDIPLGGWAGTIREVDRQSNPPTYLIEWDQSTLDQMHPVYRTRCERDDLSLESMWLGEADLERDHGGPVVVEQPTHIVSRPLSTRDPEDRIRAIFALTSDDPLPPATPENLRRYARYLATHVSFPFRANYVVETGPFQSNEFLVTVVGLVGADDCDEGDGVLCEVEQHGETFELPLADLEVRNKGRQRQLIEDYSYWFSNWGIEDREVLLAPERAIGPAPPPHPKWAVVKIVLKCGVGAALCGTVLGALLAASESAGIGAIVGALILGVIGWLVGKPNATILDEETRLKHGSIFAGILGVMGGCLIGSLLGAMLVAFVGTLSGGIVGWIIGRLAANVRRKDVDPVPGIILGAGVGAVALACHWDTENATAGALTGAGTGAVLGPVLFLAMAGVFYFLARPR